MRVLFINQYYPPDSSATAYLLGELSEDLARDHEIWVIAGRPSYNPEGSRFRPRGVHLERSWSTTFGRAGMLGRIANYVTFTTTALARALSGPRPNVIVAMTDPPIIPLIGLLAARRHRCRFVYVCADLYPDVAIALRRTNSLPVVWTWRVVNRRLRHGADRLVVVGRDMQEKLEREGAPPQRLVYIPNWASEPRVDHDAIAELRHRMGWRDRFIVMHAGNVGLAQNLPILVQAAARVSDRPKIQFVVLGDGAARAGLEEEVRLRQLRNVTFLPYRPKEEALILMAAADLHLVSLAPHLWGCAVPSKVYGIMALGLSFVAAVDQGSEIDRIIEETGAGVRVEPGDAPALAQAICQFADGTRDAKSAGTRGRTEFELKYERGIATEKYRRLLEAIAG